MNRRGAWRGGIIAAGEGSRLRTAGWTGSKAMLPIGGRPLIDHALARFRAAGIERVSVLINASSPDAQAHLERGFDGVEIDLVVKTTPSSFASFRLMAERLAGSRTAITTVDGIMPAEAFTDFIAAVEGLGEGAVALGVTTHVDDEKPLWAELAGADGRILRLGPEPAGHVTAGLYALPAQLPSLGGQDFDRLRDYLGWLVSEQFPVHGVVLPQVFDVDRPEDIVQAEQALADHACAGGV